MFNIVLLGLFDVGVAHSCRMAVPIPLQADFRKGSCEHVGVTFWVVCMKPSCGNERGSGCGSGGGSGGGHVNSSGSGA